MTQFYRVLYCSRNFIPGSSDIVAAEVQSILDVSRRNNLRAGVTGGLLFSAGCFAQVLEGPMDAVEDAFERIQCDGRHSEVTVLQAGPIASRDFPDWSMAFAGTKGDGALAGVTLASAFSGQTSAGHGLLDMLKAVVVRETDWLAPMSEPAVSRH
ncbi:BLUF domain-containing protein [Lichenicoccus sp.]|uniref:BLUF domain-containing protein n=1 Tax=Lichenicoccus sp. TaxID=2781899 RepID=UPI003D13ED46